MEEEFVTPVVDDSVMQWAWLPDPVNVALSLGGPVVLLLIVLSIIALAVIVFKGLELFALSRRRGMRRTHSALTSWQSGEREQAVQELTDVPAGIGRIVRVAMHGLLGDMPEPLVREEVQRVATGHLERMRSHLGVLEAIGTISPLLGLFGTVLGMIEAFRRMETAGAQVDPSVLSGGIWQALLTTGVGLAVAIPTVLAHRWLDRRVDVQTHLIEDAVTRVFTADFHRATNGALAYSQSGSRHAA